MPETYASVAVTESLEARALLTAVLIDYSLDTNNFFDTQEKRDLMQTAADNLAGRLSDSLSAIAASGPNTWTATFSNPATGGPAMVTNLSIPEDTLVVYAGGRDLVGAPVAFAVPGGHSVLGTQEFFNVVASRGQSGALVSPATDFGPWGGAIAFDTSVNWFFSSTIAELDGNEIDFLSAAEYTFASLLGFGNSDSWDTYVSGSSFTGAAAVAEYGGNVPLNADLSRWATGTMSDGSDAAMTPILPTAKRRLFTSLDFAALSDIGWVLSAPPAEVDYGDAPDTRAGTGSGNYQTLASDSGPSHTIVPGLFLGASVDGDDGTQQNDRANADDVDSALPDDEDGVLNPLDLQGTIGTAPSVTLLATNMTGREATLSGWIDYDGDGAFDNSTERAQIAVPDGSTDERFTLTFPTIPHGSAGVTYARFRLSTDPVAIHPTGAATDGEVEDYVFSTSILRDGTVGVLAKITDGLNNGPELQDFDFFGSTVTVIGDVDGDGVTDLAVGAYGDDTGGGDRGAVYVLFMNSDLTVRESRKLANETNGAPTLEDSDFFGMATAGIGDIDGDGVPDLAVGAFRDDTGEVNAGIVYLFFLNRDGSVKSSSRIGSNLGGGPQLEYHNYFGRSLASIGDFDGDGVGDIAVGASGDSTGGALTGSVHLLLLNRNGTVKQDVRIAHEVNGGPTLPEFVQFGSAVSLVGDLDGDGIPELAVGADIHNADKGIVYVLFMNADGSVKSTTAIEHGVNGGPLPVGTDHLGNALSPVGDIDGDGIPDLAVGAYGDDAHGVFTGVIYLFAMNPDGTVKSRSLIGSETGGGPLLASFDAFGRSIALLPDVNGDGTFDLAVSANGDRTTGLNRGAVYLLNSNAFPVTQRELVLPESGGEYEVFRDANDLVVRTAVGAELFRERVAELTRLNITGSSLADVVTVLNTGNAVTTTLQFTGADGNDRFDASLATGVVNLTGNGGDDVLIGGSGNDTLNGGSGKDELVGNAGDDLVQGQGSTGDTLDGGDGNDTLNGGSGNDLIREFFTVDVVLTNSAMTGRGADTIISAERAELTGGGAAQMIDVSAFFTPMLTSVTLDGGGGNDTLVGSDGSDVLVGSGGSDRIEGSAGGDRIIGGSGADTLIGGAGDDLLKGLGGSGDRLSGGDGNDTLNGGRGVDRFIEVGDVDFTLTTTSLTGLGTDVVQALEVAELNGGPSDNVIDVSAFVGFRGFTQLRGNGGNDLLIGSSMGDALSGGDGNDTLLGKGGDDTLNGEDGNDGLSGFTGNDVIDGGRGFDRGFGGEGNDSLLGGNAADTLIGGDGDDTLVGNDGTDTLVGGTGNNDASVGDVITDATSLIDETFMLDPLPGWVDQV